MKKNSNKQSWLVVSQLQSFTLGLWSRKGTAAATRRKVIDEDVNADTGFGRNYRKVQIVH